ncbi:MAG: hypothetical protein ACRDQ7_25755 [Haloechinothrix sp.]
MEFLGVLLLVLIALPLSLAAVIWFMVVVVRRNKHENQRLQLSSNCFTGYPEVVIAAGQWALTPEIIRRTAYERGYVEVNQPNPDALVFHHAPHSTQRPAVPHSGRPSRAQTRRRAKFTAGLATERFAWIEPSALGAGVDDVAALGRRHGFGVARVLGSRSAPMVLLSRTPIHRVDDTLSADGRKPLSSWARHWIGAGLVLCSLLMVLPLGVVANASGSVSPVLWVLGGGAVVSLIAGTAIPLIPAFGSTTSRMSRLILEFNGRMHFRLLAHHYRLDRTVIGDVATEMGYTYLGSQSSWRTSSRWNESWISYARNADYRQRAA